MSLPLLDAIVYGPVRSRRLGVSLGVNLLPAGRKICNMDCAYCQYGWTRGDVRYRGQGNGWPSVAMVEAAVAARLTIAADANEFIDRLTLAGHGEPTLHPEFEEIVTRLRAVRDRIAPAMPIAIFSNSTTAAAPDIRRALSGLDERYMKLDAGDAITFADVNGGGRHLCDILDGLRSLQAITIQAMFVRDSERRVDNSGAMAVEHWLRALETVQPKDVHVYTIDRSPALGSLSPVTPWRLREIAEHVRAIGIPARVFAPE
jgi:wyosine [tRNA(Phe)-imidazoG37] synthetase (radical SAM superfamily)